MGLVTFLPRWIPMTVLSNKKLSPRIVKFLKYIPFAALGSLIFPDILYSTNDVSSATVGTIIAVLFASFKMNIVLVVVAAILGAYFFEILL